MGGGTTRRRRVLPAEIQRRPIGGVDVASAAARRAPGASDRRGRDRPRRVGARPTRRAGRRRSLGRGDRSGDRGGVRLPPSPPRSGHPATPSSWDPWEEALGHSRMDRRGRVGRLDRRRDFGRPSWAYRSRTDVGARRPTR
jgi:hypothetical protein